MDISDPLIEHEGHEFRASTIIKKVCDVGGESDHAEAALLFFGLSPEEVTDVDYPVIR